MLCLNVEIRFVLIVIRRGDSDGATESFWELNGVNLRLFKFENIIYSKNITNRMLGLYVYIYTYINKTKKEEQQTHI